MIAQVRRLAGVMFVGMLGAVMIALGIGAALPANVQGWEVVYAVRESPQDDFRLRLLHVERRLDLPLHSHQALPSLPALSSDHRYLLWSDAAHQLTLHDTRRRRTFFSLGSGHAMSWSPDAGAFIYADNQADQTRLYRVRLEEDRIHAPELLFEQAASTASNITWSPTRDQIAFSLRYLAEQKRSSRLEDTDVYLVDLHTGQATNLSHTLISFDTGPVWSPDGTRLAFYSAEYNQFISLVNADGDALQRRGLVPGFVGVMHWSPDGTHLGYLTLNMMTYTSSLSVLPIAGEADALQLLPRVSHEGRFAWSPGSDQVAYVDAQSGALMAITVATGQQRRIHTAPGIKVILR